MKKNLQALIDAHHDAASMLRTYRGGLRLLRPLVVDRDTGRDYDGMLEANPIARRFPREEQNRMRNEMRTELERARRSAAAVARFRARGVRAVVSSARDAIARTRRDVTQSPTKDDMYNHFGPADMLAAERFRMDVETWLNGKSVSELRAFYVADSSRDDAAAGIRMSVIEAMHAGGNLPPAADDVERQARRTLELLIAEEQELRLPSDLPDFDVIEAEANRLDARADALAVVPLDPDVHPSARAAYEELLDAMTSAGEMPDAEDHEVLRAGLAS